METIFDCFFDETFLRLTRNGLQTKQNRKDVIDHLNSVISGCCDGDDDIMLKINIFHIKLKLNK